MSQGRRIWICSFTFLDLIHAKNGIYYNPFLGFYISFVPKNYEYIAILLELNFITIKISWIGNLT